VEAKQVQIYGRFYTIKGVDDQKYLDKLAKHVDAQMHQVADSTGTVDTLRVAILTALTLADQSLRAEAEHEKADTDLARNIDAISEQIELVLSAQS
jgi:cell division protein ZapA